MSEIKHFTTVCMHCQKVYRQGELPAPVSHGICMDCFAEQVSAVRSDELSEWLDEAFDELPTGVIVLDRQLRVIGYNRREEELTGLTRSRILGKQFFVDIAPCMSAREVGGWCETHIDDATIQHKTLDWLLKLKAGDRMASLEVSAGKGQALIRVLVQSEDD
jgi:photoactive yellow protein